MNVTRRLAGLVAGLVAAFALTLASAPQAAAATWTLDDVPGHPQRICVHPDHGWPNTYYLVPISGTWTTVITAGVSDLPPGSYSNGGAVHPSESGGFIGMVHVSIAPLPVGDYTATLWADDGTETQTVPVMISSSEDCY